MGHGIKMRVEMITPEVATGMLERNVCNRPLNDARVMKWATMMKRGEWIPDPSSPVCIDEERRLQNAQHRLWAIVLSGLAQEMWVARDCPVELLKVIDTGTSRSLSDVVNLNRKMEDEDSVGLNRIAATKAFFCLPEKNTSEFIWTCDGIEDCLSAADEHIQFAYDNLKCPRAYRVLRGACVVAAIARAKVNDVPESALAGFCIVLASGNESGIRESITDGYVRKIRDRFTSKEVNTSGWLGQKRAYFLIAKAISLFYSHTNSTKVIPTEADPFPLPNKFRMILGKIMKRPSSYKSAKGSQLSLLEKLEKKDSK